MTKDEVIKSIEKKDWERAYNTAMNRMPAMFKAITDPRKAVGRSAAVWLMHNNTNRYRYFDWDVEKAIKQNFKDVGFDPEELDDYDVSTNAALQKSTVYDDVMNDVAELKAFRAERAAKKEAEQKAKASAQRVQEAITIALRVCRNIASLVMYSRPTWHSFGGRIGQNSHTWYRSTGSEIKNANTVSDLLWKYDDGKHFIRVDVPGGYDADFGMSYKGGDSYSMNVRDTAYNNATYDSEASMSIYKLPKFSSKLEADIKAALAESMPDLTDEEIAKVFKIFQ